MSNKKKLKKYRIPKYKTVNGHCFDRRFTNRKRVLYSHISPIQKAGETPEPSVIKKKEGKSN